MFVSGRGERPIGWGEREAERRDQARMRLSCPAAKRKDEHGEVVIPCICIDVSVRGDTGGSSDARA